jgi:N-6 DNA Methylase
MASTLFSSKDFKPEQLNTFFQKIPQLEEKKQLIRNWQKAIANGKVQKSKEEQIKGEFLDKFFGQVLGYSYESHEAEWNLEKELKSISDNKKPDAALGFFNQKDKADVRCVIEVKGALGNLDKKQNRADFQGSPVDQAFAYVPRMPGRCEWVIVTNMIEIRLYSRTDIGRYESFQIPELLLPDNLTRFFFLFSYQQLFLERGDSKIDQIFNNRLAEQKKIGAEFYNQYKDIRLILFANLFRENPTIKPKDLFRLTQKLIDRLIFIGFVRDLRLVDNVLTELNQNIKTSFRKDNQKAWGELKELFSALNEGYSERNIPPFNGELFKPDALLDGLLVRDHQLMALVKLIQDYDFQSQLDVNILGHIFEQSIADLPEILDEIQKRSPLELAELQPESVATTKRKKDGIFYTPDYITRYMVKEAVGGWLDDRKKEILQSLKVDELPEPEFADYATIKLVKEEVQANDVILLNLQFWKAYEQKLANIKVVDPACGSGAFLNQVFDYLYNEWAKVVKPEIKKLSTPLDKQMLESSIVNEPLAFTYSGDEEWRLKKHIILNNIYGVDLNGESVEITKLSLWLKTANKTNSLAALYDNIKQGNSLIDDPIVAGDNAFDWNKAFSEIMKEGGFDVVVGNPPWGAEMKDEEKAFLKSKFKAAIEGKIDSYKFFYEKSFEVLKKSTSYLSFITPNTFQYNIQSLLLRGLILDQTDITHAVELRKNVFDDAPDVVPSILVLKKYKEANHLINRRVASSNIPIVSMEQDEWEIKSPILQSIFSSDSEKKINLRLEDNFQKIKAKIENTKYHLGDFFGLKQGTKPYGDKDDKKNRLLDIGKEKKGWEKAINGRNLERYNIDFTGDIVLRSPLLHSALDEVIVKGED